MAADVVYPKFTSHASCMTWKNHESVRAYLGQREQAFPPSLMVNLCSDTPSVFSRARRMSSARLRQPRKKEPDAVGSRTICRDVFGMGDTV